MLEYAPRREFETAAPRLVVERGPIHADHAADAIGVAGLSGARAR
jgi:hypothetical protein